MPNSGGQPTALGTSAYIKSLFSGKAAKPPTALTQLLVGSLLSQAPGGNAGAISANSLLPNNGSSNRVGFGLSDFGKSYQPPSAPAAPNVAGQGKHGGVNLKQAAINAITSQYGPVLGAYNAETGQLTSQAAKDKAQAQQQGNRAEGDLATLYSRLRQYAGNTEKAQNQDYRGGVRNTKQLFNNLQQQINSTFSGSSGAVAADLKRMGLNPADAMSGAAQDATFTAAQAARDRANQILNTRASRREYDAGMGRMKNDIIATGNAAVGSQRSQTNAALNDIAKQLNQNLMQVNMQKAQTLGQQAGALGQLKLSELQAAQKSKDPMAKLNMLYKLAQIKHLQQVQAAGPLASTKTPKGMDAALAYLQQMYPAGTANWSGMKGQQLSKNLLALQLAASAAKPGTVSGGAAWDPKQYGDLFTALWKQLATVKGPKGNPMYGPTDQTAEQRALQIALGLA